MLTAFTLATLLAAAPTGNARLDHGSATEITLRLTSFETERVAVPKRGTFTSAELLYRTPKGDRLDLRILYREPGELPARNVTSITAQTAAAGLSSWTAEKKTGCRVKLYKVAATELSGKVECTAPESGEPFDAVFDAKK
ncbi:MAG: hypothetical protein WCC48_08400 [Anaeromyxobacteraceae bacterium]